MADTLAVRGAIADTEELVQRARVSLLADLRTRWAGATARQKNEILAALNSPPATQAARYVAATAPLEPDDTITDANVDAKVSEYLNAVLPAATP